MTEVPPFDPKKDNNLDIT